MKKLLLLTAVSVFALVMMITGTGITKDYTGCYICKGQSGTYVKYRGSDDFSKRKKAKALGCDVGGTSGSCDAANLKILGTVD